MSQLPKTNTDVEHLKAMAFVLTCQREVDVWHRAAFGGLS